jgi:hypothetical protein
MKILRLMPQDDKPSLPTIDGTRSGLDIYRLVAAEAREGGEHYLWSR